jgi:hypothetical protein
MADYRFEKDPVDGSMLVVRNKDSAIIPANPANRDYAAYLVYAAAGGATDPYVAPPPPPITILSQDLITQLLPADQVKINAAIAGDSTGRMSLLWNSMVSRRDPMDISSTRFQTGWQTLVSVLGQARMNDIATAMGRPTLVVPTS